MRTRRLVVKAPRSIIALFLALCGFIVCSLGMQYWLAWTNLDLFARWDLWLTRLRMASSIAFFAILTYTIIRHGQIVESESQTDRS